MLDSKQEFKKSIISSTKHTLPDFIIVDHPVYVEFINAYYKYLQSAKVILTGTNYYLKQETNTINYVLDENSDNILLEESTSDFVANEIITGQTSNATATVLVQTYDTNKSLYITSNNAFIEGERIVGGTSGAAAIISSYLPNPVQSIQQFTSLVDTDSTLSSLLDKFRDKFLESIPNTLAEDVVKKQLIKNVKDLYSAKGTEKAHKLFFRALFNESSDLIYPRERILKVSDGQWSTDSVIRVIENGTSDFTNLVGITVYTLTLAGEIQSSAYVTNVIRFREGATVITEISIDINSLQGTFTAGETIYGIDPTIDLEISASIKSIVTGVSVQDGGNYYNGTEDLVFQTLGNNASAGTVSSVSQGSIDEVVILNGGTGYQINDTVVFNNTNTNGVGAAARVSVVGGSVLLEDATASDNLSTEISNIITETGTGDSTHDPGQSVVGSGDVLQYEDATFNNASGTPVDTNIQLNLQENQNNKLLSETSEQTILESETFTNLGVPSESNEIRKVVLTNKGVGYSTLPTVSVQETSGRSGASLIAVSNQSPGIGSVQDVSMLSFGLNYDTVPTVSLPTNIIVKNVTGTLTSGDTFTTVSGENGTIVSFDSVLSILRVSSDATSFPVADKITSASGATAIVHFANPASLQSSIGTIATTSGRYVTDRSRISEVSIRLQDSYYYQDYSYVVKVGQSINVWRNSVKRAIHPAGWNVFGEIVISNSVTGSITRGNTFLGGVPGTEFSPIIFGSVFGRRLGTIHQGVVNENANRAVSNLDEVNFTNIVLEDAFGNGKIVLESSTNLSGYFGGKVRAEQNLRAVTLTSDLRRRQDGDANRQYGMLANLPIFAFTVPRLDSSDVASNWYGINRTKSITELNKSIVDGEYYTIQQFGHIKISDVCDSSGNIPSAAFTTKINVPPPGEIILRKRSRTLDSTVAARFSELGITFDRNTFTLDDSA